MLAPVIVTVPVRDDVLPFAVTLTETEPLLEPEAGDTEIQL